MTDPTAIGFLKSIKQILLAASDSKKKQVNTLKSIADRKFSEIYATHILFVKLLREIHDAALEMKAGSRKTDDIESLFSEVYRKLDQVRDARDEGREVRVSLLQEADVFANKELMDKGFYISSQGDLPLKLMLLMRSYVRYFQSERSGVHDLGHALRYATLVLDRIKNENPSKSELEKASSDIAKKLDTLISHNEEMWLQMSKSYYEYNHEMIELGYYEDKSIILADAKPAKKVSSVRNSRRPTSNR